MSELAITRKGGGEAKIELIQGETYIDANGNIVVEFDASEFDVGQKYAIVVDYSYRSYNPTFSMSDNLNYFKIMAVNVNSRTNFVSLNNKYAYLTASSTEFATSTFSQDSVSVSNGKCLLTFNCFGNVFSDLNVTSTFAFKLFE